VEDEMPTETTLNVVGMHCGNCAQRLSLVLERHEGVLRAEVDPAGTAVLRFDEAKLRREQLADLVRAAGFDLTET
jgi:copper chaperone CopZ